MTDLSALRLYRYLLGWRSLHWGALPIDARRNWAVWSVWWWNMHWREKQETR